MQFQLAKLQLVNHRLISFHIEVNEKSIEKSEQESYNFDFDFDIYQAEKNMLFKIPLEIILKASDGCDFCRLNSLLVKLEGIFSLPEGMEPSEIKRYVPFNCLAMLYGVARSIVSNITANNPGGPFVLPMMNFSIHCKEESRPSLRKPRRIARKKPTLKTDDAHPS